MQEAKRFSTALFGFDRKAVLDYIYEQDKQAREALEELAVRNDTLVESLTPLPLSCSRTARVRPNFSSQG